jgi:hypothetical protein
VFIFSKHQLLISRILQVFGFLYKLEHTLSTPQGKRVRVGSNVDAADVAKVPKGEGRGRMKQ